MKKIYTFLSLILSPLFIYGAAPKSDIHLVFPSEYDSFSEAFSKLFQDKSDVWLILGNRGAKNLYRERFSSNWFYWDLTISDKALGVSGDACIPANWEAAYENFPQKINYIAVDFNGLINNRKRNEILKSASKVLCEGGIFCLEDDFLPGINRLKHFSDQDLAELSKTFDIKFAHCDGFVSSLPYTCDISMNRRNNIYKGLEKMVLRLASANNAEKRQLMPYISGKLIRTVNGLSEAFIEDLVKNVVHSSLLDKMITEYQSLQEQQKEYKEKLDKEVENLNSLQIEVDGYRKLYNLSSKAMGKFQKLSDQASQTLNRFKRVTLGINNTVENKPKKEKGGLLSGLDAVNEPVKTSTKEKDTESVLQEKLSQLKQIKFDITSLESKIQATEISLENLEKEILKYEDQVFKQLEKDKFLNRYIKYQKKDLNKIIADSAEANKKFMIDYDSESWWLSEMEVITKELENSWSPHVILTNLVTLDELKAQKNVPSVQQVLVILENKTAAPMYQPSTHSSEKKSEEESKERPTKEDSSATNSSESEPEKSEEQQKKISAEEAEREAKELKDIEEMISKSEAELSELRKYLSTLEQNKKDAEAELKNSEPKIVNASINDHMKFLDSEITKINAKIKEMTEQNDERLKAKDKLQKSDSDELKSADSENEEAKEKSDDAESASSEDEKTEEKSEDAESENSGDEESEKTSDDSNSANSEDEESEEKSDEEEAE